jgi:hypothetical protein
MVAISLFIVYGDTKALRVHGRRAYDAFRVGEVARSAPDNRPGHPRVTLQILYLY